MTSVDYSDNPSPRKPLDPDTLSRRKGQGAPLVMATAYDFFFARILEEAGVDLLLVGDSAAQVMFGLPSTREITVTDMLLLVGAAARGAPNTHVVADMPYGSDFEPQKAIEAGRRFLAAGALSVKLEGAKVEVVQALVAAGIPVMGHLGLLPQTAASFKQVGHGAGERETLLHEAQALVEAGIYALLLEHLDFTLAAAISSAVRVPTIGIGAGNGVGGQVLVLHDLLGMQADANRKLPPFARRFADLRSPALMGLRDYCRAVRDRTFPA